MSGIEENYKRSGLEIAIIGMAGRFPGADSIDELWDIFVNGRDIVSELTVEDLKSENVSKEVIDDENYIRRKGLLKNLWRFDGDFFGYSKKEVEIMDPQMRLLHEVVYEALEDSGYHPDKFDGDIGMYSGGISNRYWEAVASQYRSGFKEMFDAIHLMDKDFSSSRVSHKLNLRGPSVSISTACTSSLTAVHFACRGLLTGECTIAIAGGYSVMLPEKTGYYYVENSLTSKDGYCRPFDENGTGTCGGDGIGIVVLKLLDDAIRDKDHIYAVIKGTAINNDGADKPIYTAPNVEGDVNVIKKALSFADVLPETINFVEAHATGTQMGDYIEFEALKEAYNTQKRGFCKLCSHKPNIGYLGPASGVTGLIKSALSLKYKLLPPSINFEKPNRNIDFENSPFSVNTVLEDLDNHIYPLRAAVNNIAVGGTNAHIILEEAPKCEKQHIEKEWYLLPLSARSESALEILSERLCQYLIKNQSSEVDLLDIENTLQSGRKDFEYRRIVVCKEKKDAVQSLLTLDNSSVKVSKISEQNMNVAFLFPDKGYQYQNLNYGLYNHFEPYRAVLDECLSILSSEFNYDLKDKLFSECSEISSIDIAELIIFTTEYSLGKFLIDIGVIPDVLVGYGVGEYVAACLSGALNLLEAYRLIALRGKLLKELQPGKWFKVSIDEKELEQTFGHICFLNTLESSNKCIVSVKVQNVEEFKKRAKELKISILEVPNSYPCNTEVDEHVLNCFRQELEKVTFMPLTIPIVSSVYGEFKVNEVMNANYWLEHLKRPINLFDSISTVLKRLNLILLELGPGKVFNKLISQNKSEVNNQVVVTMVRNQRENAHDSQILLTGLGKLWSVGVDINWEKLNNSKQGYRVSLPKYPFEGERVFIG